MLAEISPRLLFGCVFARDLGNVQQHRLAPFLNGKMTKPRRIDAWRTQELRGHAQIVQGVTILTKAKRHADFFIADGGQVWRQGRIKILPVMTRPALDGNLEQPIGDAFTRTTDLRDAAQQPGIVRNLAQFMGERRCKGLFVQFHANIRNKNDGRAKGF